MGILGVILFLAIGVGAAALFDKLFLQPRQQALRMIQDEALRGMLERSKSYARLQGNQEYTVYRPDDWDCDNDFRVEQIGERGDGGKVLRLRSGREM